MNFQPLSITGVGGDRIHPLDCFVCARNARTVTGRGLKLMIQHQTGAHACAIDLYRFEYEDGWDVREDDTEMDAVIVDDGTIVQLRGIPVALSMVIRQRPDSASPEQLIECIDDELRPHLTFCEDYISEGGVVVNHLNGVDGDVILTRGTAPPKAFHNAK
jgi:hypothetical protein